MKRYFITLLITFYSVHSTAQAPELGIMLGGSYYTGDLNPYKHFNSTKFAFGLIYRNQIRSSDRLSWRMHFMYGEVTANDANSTIESNVNRNLNFKSRILEFGPILEIHFLPYEIGSNQRPGTPYLFFGLNYFKMNPKGQYNDDWIELQPLTTEGQGTSLNDKSPYRLNQLSIPMGLGLKVNISNRFSLGMEYGVRKTFTDYIDDVSGNYAHNGQLAEEAGSLSASMADRSLTREGLFGSNEKVARGNPNNKDWYYFFGLTINFRLVEYTTCKPRKHK
jgi:hypothetical protein